MSEIAAKRVVILGGGFAGLNAARKLGGRREFQVTLIDRHNHHTFQPLLYQVATAALSEQEIADPLRSLLAKHRNVRVVQAEATDIEINERRVRTTHGEFTYDYLLVACGADNSYFGHDSWEASAPGLKSLAQAVEIRARLLDAFEAAADESRPDVRKRLLTFVVIGGGATGVEMAGAIAEMARQMLKELHVGRTGAGRIVLLEAGPRLLTSFDPRLAERARRDLASLGVDVLLNTRVIDVRESCVQLEHERLDAGVIVWAAGVIGVPLARSIGAALDSEGRVIVGADCTIAGHPEVFVAGDLARCLHHRTGQPLGQVANVAAQQGRYFARSLMRDIRGQPRVPFKYFNKGQMATIGVFRALCEIGPVRFGGLPAWAVWIGIHIYYLSSMRNRFFVFLRWAWSLVTKVRHARVIVRERQQNARSQMRCTSATVRYALSSPWGRQHEKESALKLAKYVKFRDEKFGGVLFETRSEKVFTLNPAAAAIVREIAAGSEEQQIALRLKSRFRDPHGALEQESAAFIAELRRRGLVESG